LVQNCFVLFALSLPNIAHSNTRRRQPSCQYFGSLSRTYERRLSATTKPTLADPDPHQILLATTYLRDNALGRRICRSILLTDAYISSRAILSSTIPCFLLIGSHKA
jgi:hypothetical protein